jgi:alpha-ribazole phosphatase/probable phosphoglycerate mutase
VILTCLRHAESENVVAGASGALPDAPLTVRGEAQARAVLIGTGTVYASAAVRARRTAELLGGGGHRVVVRPGLAEFGIGAREGVVDAALRRETADVLHAWVVAGDLDRRVADGETGHQVLARMTAVLTEIAAAGADAGLVGHVGSLTLTLSVLCRLGGTVWGAPLPHAVPFAVRWDGDRWECPQWPSPG